MLRKHHVTLASDVYTMPLASEIELLALTGDYEKALSMMRTHRFRIWKAGRACTRRSWTRTCFADSSS